jgi:hypothetical protein
LKIETPKDTVPFYQPIIMSNTTNIIVNRGTGAGGAATNANGKSFEDKTNNEERLAAAGWTRHAIGSSKGKSAFYLQSPDGRVKYVSQSGLKAYAAAVWSKELFRCPDEAYIIETPSGTVLKILEKKNQNGPGSVDQKLGLGNWFKREYKKALGNTIVSVEYAFCISSYLKTETQSNTTKWNVARELLAEDSIAILFGDDADYFHHLDTWISNISS